MRSVVVVVVVALARVAVAQPSEETAFEACKVRRHAQTVEAMRIADVQERGRRLIAMEECRRPGVERAVAVVERREPAVLGPWLAVTLGAGVSTMSYASTMSITPVGGAPSATGATPFAEVELAWRFSRGFSFGAFAAYAAFRDASYLRIYDVHHDELDIGVRARAHLGRVGITAGIGADVDRAATIRNVLVYMGTSAGSITYAADIDGYTTPLLLFTLGADVTVARRGRVAVLLQATIAYAATTEDVPRILAISGNVASARVGFGVRY